MWGIIPKDNRNTNRRLQPCCSHYQYPDHRLALYHGRLAQKRNEKRLGQTYTKDANTLKDW